MTVKQWMKDLSDEGPEYEDVCLRERRLFIHKYGDGYEAVAFPLLFPYGTGTFTAKRVRNLRFTDYAGLLQRLSGGQFRDDARFTAWCKLAENELFADVANEIAAERAAAATEALPTAVGVEVSGVEEGGGGGAASGGAADVGSEGDPLAMKQRKPKKPVDVTASWAAFGFVKIHPDHGSTDNIPPEVFTEDPSVWIPDPDDEEWCVDCSPPPCLRVKTWGLTTPLKWRDMDPMIRMMQSHMNTNDHFIYQDTGQHTPQDQFILKLVGRKATQVKEDPAIIAAKRTCLVLKIWLNCTADGVVGGPLVDTAACYRIIRVPASISLAKFHDQVLTAGELYR